jgi:hypothetical protein
MLNLNEYLKALQPEGLFPVRQVEKWVVPGTVLLQTCFQFNGTWVPCPTTFSKLEQCLSVPLGVYSNKSNAHFPYFLR